MKSRILGIVFILLVSFGALSAQDAKGPEEPAIVLPRMVLTIDDLSARTFPAILPRSSELRFVASALRLSEPPVPPLPESILHPQASEEGAGKVSDSSLVTQGVFGAGSMNSLLGSLSLFRTGEKDSLRLRFSHEGSDGWDFRAPGTGYSGREENLDGRAVFRGASGETVAEGNFTEREVGLQGKAAAVSAVSRFFDAGFSSTYRPGEDFTLHGAFSGAAASRLYSLPAGTVLSREDAEYSLRGNAKVRYGTERAGIYADGGWSYRAVPDYGRLPGNRLDAGLGAEYSPADGWNLEGKTGAAWNDEDGAFFPFRIDVSGTAGDSVSFSVRGGRKAEEWRYFDLWKEEALLALVNGLADGRTWYCGASVEARAVLGLFSVKLAFDAEYRENALVAGDFVSGDAAFPVTQDDLASFPLSLEIRSSPRPGLTFAGSWRYIPGERALFEPLHEGRISLDFAPQKGSYGLNCSGAWSSGNDLPEIGLRGFLRPLEGLEFSLSFEDLLAPLLTDGRTRHDPFVDKGFRVTLKTLLSF